MEEVKTVLALLVVKNIIVIEHEEIIVYENLDLI